MHNATLRFAMTVLGAACVAGAARADLIQFEHETPGNFANGSFSADSTHVSFSNGLAPEFPMQVFNSLMVDTAGQSLVVSPDPGLAVLTLNFTVPIYSLSISFGNDEPLRLVTGVGGDLAVLNLYDGASLLETISVEPNANDAIDQVISWTYGGTAATRAEFYYGQSNLDPIELPPTVDNISFSIEVPEPSTYAAVGFVGLAAALAWRRRKKS